MGEFPDDWSTRSIGSFATVKRGASPRPIDNPRWFSHEGPGWVRIRDVTAAGDRLRSTEDHLSAEGAVRSVSVAPGDVIMSIAATIGLTTIVDMDARIHDGFVKISPDESVDREFLVRLLRQSKARFLAAGQTGTQSNINSQIVADTLVQLPRLAEQRRIAEILDTIDETIQATERVIAKLSVAGTALLGEVLRQSAGVGEAVSLDSTGTWLSGGTPSTGEPSFWGGAVPWITASSLRGKYLTRSKRTLTTAGVAAGSRLVPEGTLLCVVRGMSLKNEFRVGIAGTELAFGQDCKALRPGDDWIPEFLYLQLLARESEILKLVDEASHGTGRLQMSLLGSLSVDRVPIGEQHRLVALFNAHEQRIATERDALAKLGQTRSGLTADLLSGRVRTVAA